MSLLCCIKITLACVNKYAHVYIHLYKYTYTHTHTYLYQVGAIVKDEDCIHNVYLFHPVTGDLEDEVLPCSDEDIALVLQKIKVDSVLEMTAHFQKIIVSQAAKLTTQKKCFYM